MTKPEARFYKEAPPRSKNISHCQVNYHLTAHEAPKPSEPFKDHHRQYKVQASMRTSQIVLTDDIKYSTPSKKLHPQCQTVTSDWSASAPCSAKKMSSVKTKEIVGS